MAEQSTRENETLPTILDPTTCVKKGLCTVATGRAVQTHQLYYELHGSLNGAQKMLFVMGLNNSCSGWSNQVKHFSRKPDHSVLVFDNRGVGNSDAGPLGIYKTSEMAKDTVDLMEYLGWTEERSVHLFGVSMGGMISQELCLLVPKRFKSVSFISTKAGNKFDLPSMNGLYSLTRLLSRTLTEEQSIEMLMNMLFPAEFLAQSTEGGGTKRDEIYESLVQRVRKTRKQPASGVVGQLSAALSHSCPTASLARIARELEPAKVLVLTGDLDQLINPLRSIELHQALPNSEYLLIPGAGHAICSQLPEQSNNILERVMDEGNRAFS
ncbi:uncharacterized protein PGTG_17853 [Puccinia graminis f. sp. tritici CRL 75-36-700-3]|uniref:AB hydrolase-1 domain-containing protein n=1 Tax=Puccinia graminis f. sp. tritici (strain CRL 75-36-700-3 / race SCCL) TaxID=418459 RepID=E3L647_PUCGT|nr:uncharacterized protein PGTG_17853 [Puccinia graminis f. sp. tritici CRL 75-36-700-3]EFP92022.1 hypothetical protein PGTG_17853 [Puccinia graminis f. sp. tritici CRL 75-36-700-3]